MAGNGENGAEDSQPAMDHGSEGGIPGHFVNTKRLINNHGHFLAISPDKVYGTRDRQNAEAILRFSNESEKGVRIQGLASGMYVAMDDNGLVYSEVDGNSDNCAWIEMFVKGYNEYVWKKGTPDKCYYLGIKKRGDPKPGLKAKSGQKAVRFLPLPV